MPRLLADEAVSLLRAAYAAQHPELSEDELEAEFSALIGAVVADGAAQAQAYFEGTAHIYQESRQQGVTPIEVFADEMRDDTDIHRLSAALMHEWGASQPHSTVSASPAAYIGAFSNLARLSLAHRLNRPATEAEVAAGATAYGAERKRQSHMNADVHASCIRAALEAASKVEIPAHGEEHRIAAMDRIQRILAEA